MWKSSSESSDSLLVSSKYKNPGERFDWSTDRVAIGKREMRLGVKTCAEVMTIDGLYD